MDVILMISPEVNISPNRPRSPIMRLPSHAGKKRAASSESVMRVHVNDCSSIYAVQFGFQTGLCGLDNGGIQAQPLGALETKDAWRTRIKWYCGLALFRNLALARLEGVRV